MSYPNIIQNHTNDINTIKSTYLPKSGGVMTGTIYTPGYGRVTSENSTSQKSLALLGSSSKGESCASINLKSIEDTDEPGFFYINAKDDTYGTKSLVGRPNGTLTWGGSQIHTDATYSGVSFLKCNETLSYGWNGLQYFNKTMTASEDVGQNVSPTADWYHIIRMNHANGNGYYVDLAACFHTDRLYTRRVASGSCATGWNEIPVLVHPWRSGTQWYKKYSDGWIEQGGRVTTTTSSGTITFPIGFSDTNYIIVAQEGATATAEATNTDTGGYGDNMGLTNFTTTTVRYSCTAKRFFNWYACGY